TEDTEKNDEAHGHCLRSSEWIFDSHAIMVRAISHVFGVQNIYAAIFACRNKHAIPVRKAESGAEVEREGEYAFSRQAQREHVEDVAEILLRLSLRDMAGILHLRRTAKNSAAACHNVIVLAGDRKSRSSSSFALASLIGSSSSKAYTSTLASTAFMQL